MMADMPSEDGEQPETLIRLHKAVAASGFCSRRAAETLIAAGRVSVNGQPITGTVCLVNPQTDRIAVDGQVISAPPAQFTTYALHKPKGVVSSRVSQGREPAVTDLVPADPPVYPIGRLDKDSEGLILLTNDGDLALRLTHPRFRHAKEYQVACRKTPDSPSGEKIRQTLLKGVTLGDGKAAAEAVQLEEETADSLVLRLTVREGRHHLIRRMCARLGLKVRTLCRLRIGHLSLQNLAPGQYRSLSERELRPFQ
jgi:23S rRNA pseudouridine2605 synthase